MHSSETNRLGLQVAHIRRQKERTKDKFNNLMEAMENIKKKLDNGEIKTQDNDVTVTEK